VKGFLGLGSNAGDRLANLRAARRALERRGIEVTAASSVYETEPQGQIAKQPDYLNACLAVETELEPEQLLRACKHVERELGRGPAGPRHGPRPIDIDVLMLGGLEHDSEPLRIPHPELTGRRFVLEPLLELDPGVRLPDGSALSERLPDVAGQRVERVGAL
jgi:2-amino-4-hydroxy-6-hydroxymethyldihydropteridine diphosphokinase